MPPHVSFIARGVTIDDTLQVDAGRYVREALAPFDARVCAVRVVYSQLPADLPMCTVRVVLKPSSGFIARCHGRTLELALHGVLRQAVEELARIPDG